MKLIFILLIGNIQFQTKVKKHIMFIRQIFKESG